MTEEYDVVIVGARVAGSITAALLGEAGARVLLVDAASFPSDTISTHFFRGGGLGVILRRLGVLDEVLALGPPRLTREYTFRDGAEPTIGDPQVPGEIGYSLSVRRLPLDRVLIERARRTPGVEIRESTAARELLRDDDGRVTGIVLQDAGERRHVLARLVIGADGRGSLVARLVDAAVRRRARATRAMYFRYLRGYPGVDGPPDGPEFSFRGDELAYAFPSDDAVTCLAVSINLGVFQRFREHPDIAFDEAIRRHAGMAPRYGAVKFEGRMLGSGPKDAVARQPTGPGWALVGDAGLHQDPWTGLGMDNAATHASFLAEAIAAWLSGTKEAVAFRDYGRRRDEHALPGFKFTATFGRNLSRL